MAFLIETESRLTTVDVTDRIAAAVPDDLESGTCTAFVHHTMAGLPPASGADRAGRDDSDRD